MIKLVGLTGTIYSGKTTLAEALANEGYVHVNFSRMLKVYAERALFACGNAATVEYIEANKDSYRAFLQELGVLIGFDTHPRYVLEALALSKAGERPIVFEAVRTEEQAAVLRSFGFKIVQLAFPDRSEQAYRAVKMNANMRKFHDLLQHPVEQGIQNPDLVLDATEQISYNVQAILNVDLQ
jgi:dephospho-CoA kinase